MSEQTTGGVLTRERFLTTIDRPREIVKVPELGGSVEVVGMTTAERTRYEMDITTGKGQKREINVRELREKLLLVTLGDGAGGRLLREEDKPALGAMPAMVIERLFDVARRLSGMTEADVAELGNG